ncbi:hypothetical protein D3C81_617870 [compost metagenome]
MIRLRPQLDRHRLTDLEAPELLLRQADQHLTLAIGSQGEHGLTGGNHLAHFDLTLGDHPILGSAQHGVFSLIAGHVEFGPHLFEAGKSGTVEVFAIVVLGTADHLPVEQGLVAVTLGLDQVQVGFSGGQLRTAGLQLQAHILRVEFGQRLLGLDPLPLLHQTLADLAADPERQLRLEARTHLARIAVGSGAGRLRLHHHGGAQGSLWRALLPAGSEQQGEADRQSEGQGMAQHDE